MSVARPFTVSPALTGIAIGYSNPAQSLIADQFLPRVPVGAEKFKWLQYPLAEGFTVPDTSVGRKGSVNKVDFSAVEQTSSTKDYGLGDLIPQTDIDQAKAQRDLGLSVYDPEMHSAAWITNLIVLDREVRVAALAQNPANYNAARVFAFSGQQQFSDYANSDPIGAIQKTIDSTLVFRANTLTFGFTVWQALRSHPKIVNAIKGNVTGQGIVTREEFRQLFDVKNLLIGESWVNASRKGQAANLQRTWGKNLIATYIDPTARPEGGVTFGFSPQFGTRIAGTVLDADIGLKGGREIRVGEQISELIVAPDVGAIITNAVA